MSIYFFSGCVVLASCLVGYSYVDRYKQSEHRDDYEPVHDVTTVIDSSPRIGLELHDRIRERGEQEDELESDLDEDQLQSPHSCSPENDGGPSESNTPSDPILGSDLHTEGGDATTAVWTAVKGPASCIFLTFTVTLALFPGWISRLRSSHECRSRFRLFNDLYTPFSFLIFNAGDLCGRILSEKVPVGRIRNMSLKLVVAAVLRVVFFPLFFLCVAGGERQDSVWTIQSDLYSFTIQLLFAFTNGILLSCSFMHAPCLISNTTSMQERSSEILTFAVSFGLLNGSLLSFPFSNIAAH